MHPYLRAALICIAIVVTAMFWGVVFWGCAAAPTPVWNDAYNADWGAVCACWGVRPDLPVVTVREDCQPTTPQMFRAGGNGKWVHGITEGNQIGVCPDLAGLRHEFSEYVKRFAPGGGAFENGSGRCFL